MICYVRKSLKANFVLKNPSGKLVRKTTIRVLESFFIEAFDFIKANISWIIGNGGDILVLDNSWIPCYQGLRKPFSVMLAPTFELEICGTRIIIQALVNSKIFLMIKGMLKIFRSTGFKNRRP